MNLKICIPGKSVSTEFLIRFSILMAKWNNEHKVEIITKYSPNIYYARMACLKLDAFAPETQAPFNEEPYDKILWIDTDIIFSLEDAEEIINSDKVIYAARYGDGTGRLCAADKDFNFLPLEHSDQTEVLFAGMGLMAVRQGVFEVLGYHAFRPMPCGIGFTADDVSFCMRAKEEGFPTTLSKTRVLHEKLTMV